MNEQLLKDKTILITGAARRVGRLLALGCARGGADVIIHHGHSLEEALGVQKEIASLGRRAWVLPADLSNADEVFRLVAQANALSPLYALVNSAAIFEELSLQNTTLEDWERHLSINLTAPFLLSQTFAKQTSQGRIVNIVDWRALRPGKAALAALTKSLAVALAPNITVNALAFGAILPPADKPAGDPSASDKVIEYVPAKRWSEAGEIEDALVFLLSGPAYITGEIIHVDGGRHLV
jgi:NAD(P)-dependent dehydrogenase (short-subunit alcohol dehydrogenase family)